jgi:hypothetical protein
VDINHPDQYYTITKEKGQKMPRFNTGAPLIDSSWQRFVNNTVYTYLQQRAGFSYFYPKRKVLADGESVYNPFRYLKL